MSELREPIASGPASAPAALPDDRARLRACLERIAGPAGRHGGLAIDAHGAVVGRYFHAGLTSVFQAIVDARSGAAAGVQAFVRCTDDHGEGLAPWRLFFDAADDGQAILLDRLCRTVHAFNYLRLAPQPGRLFLKVHPRLVTAVPADHGRTYADVLERIGIAPARVVIVLPAEVTAQPLLAARASGNYRRNGFEVALEFARLAHAELLIRAMRPDHVKLDVRDLRAAPGLASGVIAAAADSGARVLVARCESPEDIALASACRADLLQGYAVTAPAPYAHTA